MLDRLIIIIIELTYKGRIYILNKARYKCTQFMASESIGMIFSSFIDKNTLHSHQEIERYFAALL